MDNTLLPDPSQIDSWPKAIAFIFQVFFIVGLPILITYSNRKVDRNTVTTNEIKATLTEKNGGSTVKDTLDEIKEVVYGVQSQVNDLNIRVTAVEGHETVTIVTDPPEA